MPFFFGVGHLTARPSVAAHLAWWRLRQRRETPSLSFHLPPACFRRRKRPGSVFQGLRLLSSPLLLLTLRLSQSPACSRQWEASVALDSFSPSAAREWRHPCQWQRPKPQLKPGHGEDRRAEVGGQSRGLCSSGAREQAGLGSAAPQPWAAALAHHQSQFGTSGVPCSELSVAPWCVQ